MKRGTFLKIAGGAALATGGVGYLLSDKRSFVRKDIQTPPQSPFLQADEGDILYLASLAPSGHNTQPWFIKYLEPYHWIIGNDKAKWLPAVDPEQRETILSIGAFIQNLEYAASHFGYDCRFELLAAANQDENLVDVKLDKSTGNYQYDVSKIKNRRTVRSNYLNTRLKKADLDFLTGEEPDFFSFIEKDTDAYNRLNEQTIEANRVQANRDAAQAELSEWIRFSNADAAKYCDGLTPASMEVEGLAGWILRNFYGKSEVMKKGFRDQGVDKVKEQVARSAGWMLITSKDNTVMSLLECGKRMQRLFLKIREKNIALHPMTQILEEAPFNREIGPALGIRDNIQFVLRMGYLDRYPQPVSLRRPVERFLRP
jgi:hypothetical protein